MEAVTSQGPYAVSEQISALLGSTHPRAAQNQKYLNTTLSVHKSIQYMDLQPQKVNVFHSEGQVVDKNKIVTYINNKCTELKLFWGYNFMVTRFLSKLHYGTTSS